MRAHASGPQVFLVTDQYYQEPDGTAVQQCPNGVTCTSIPPADPTGVKDSTLGIQAAIDVAQQAGSGNIVEFPYGEYALFRQISAGTSITVSGTAPVALQGDLASDGSLPLLDEQVGKNLLNVQVDGSTVNQLSFNTVPETAGSTASGHYTSSAQSAVTVAASSTLFENSVVTGGPNTYAIYYPGPSGASRDNMIFDTDNEISHVTASDLWNRDGVSFSFQQHGVIQYLDHTGTRLALFVDQDVEVDNDTFHPGPQTASTQGWWITAPSDNIRINNFTTYGNGGTIGSAGQQSTNIQVNNEKFMNPGFHMSVGEVTGLTINGCDFGSNSQLNFISQHHATGVVVENCSSLPVVRFAQPKSAPGTVSAEFDNDTFPAFTPQQGEGQQTFLDSFDGPSDFTVNNGTFQNCAGGLFHGTNTTFEVTSLGGYPCDPNDQPPAAALSLSQGDQQLGVQADASASTDTDTTPIVDYQFHWGDGNVSARQASATMSHTYGTQGTYTVTVDVIDKAGLHSTTSQQIQVAWQNLVGNPGFETGVQGWAAGAGTQLGRSSTAHSGSYSAQLSRTSTQGRTLLRDAPAWNSSTTAGTTCYVKAWVQAPSKKVYVRLLEKQGSTTVSNITNFVKTSGSSWVLLTGQAAVVHGGDALHIQIYAPLTVGQALLVDDVSEVCH